MPGSYQRPEGPWEQWTVAQWEAYRSDLFACRDRSSGEWWERTGRACVAMADSYIARLA